MTADAATATQSISRTIVLDRQAGTPLAQQIYRSLRDAIHEGRLAADTRLPSWRDLASALGVARGTVRLAYERLSDEQLVIARGAAGTCVAHGMARRADPNRGDADPNAAAPPPLPLFSSRADNPPLPFQMGVPAQDAFPHAVWSRVMGRAARTAARAPVSYPDPQGLPALRREIAAYLAVARGMACTAGQIFVTNGYGGALGLATRGLAAFGVGPGSAVWMEEPGFPPTRQALTLAGLHPVPIPVDEEGIDVAAGSRHYPDARAALVTPGQQAPLGVTLSRPRRLALLAWAQAAGTWIIEDDYLGELQLNGRAAPALAALDSSGRVLYAGTFSKTLTPCIRLGFLAVPRPLTGHFGAIAAGLGPAPANVLQGAVATFLADGHFLRHIRRMKLLYAARQRGIMSAWNGFTGGASGGPLLHAAPTGLAVTITLKDDCDDVAVALAARQRGLIPTPLSPWFSQGPAKRGLLLGVTNVPVDQAESCCRRLHALSTI